MRMRKKEGELSPPAETLTQGIEPPAAAHTDRAVQACTVEGQRLNVTFGRRGLRPIGAIHDHPGPHRRHRPGAWA